jgi:O-antigen/teichoic acid export membrane protein
MAGADEGFERGVVGGVRRLADPARPLGLRGKIEAIVRNLLGLMTLRATTIAAKFALTLFIARYLGLAPLGVYGIIVSATVLAPVLLGFGVVTNLAREAARSSPDAIMGRLLQYFGFLVPAYAVASGLLMLIHSESPVWILLLGLLFLLEHVQNDMFTLMTLGGHPYGANLVFFIRSAGWALVYMPLAIADPGLRNLKIMGLFWLAGDLAATALAVGLTLHWRWRDALMALPRTKLALPHKHGSTTLYLNNVANTGFVYIDRYIIGFFLSAETLGIYTFFWSIVNAMSNLVGTALVQTRMRELVQTARGSSSSSFYRSLRALAASSGQTAFGLSVAAIALAYIAIPHLKRPGLLDHIGILYILCGGLVLRMIYEVSGISFYAYGRDDITLHTGIFVFIVSVLLNFAFVPTVGIWGASAVLAVSYALGVAARGLVILRGFRPV